MFDLSVTEVYRRCAVVSFPGLEPADGTPLKSVTHSQ